MAFSKNGSKMFAVWRRRAIPYFIPEGMDKKRKSHSVNGAAEGAYTESFRKAPRWGLFYLSPIPYKMFSSYTEKFRRLPVELSASRSQ